MGVICNIEKIKGDTIDRSEFLRGYVIRRWHKILFTTM